MSDSFDIIDYMSGLTAFVFDKAVLANVAMERGVSNVTSFEELTLKDKDLLRADLLYTAYCSPSTWGSHTQSHGSYTKSVGSQQLTSEDKERLFNLFYSIYRKYDDDKLEEIAGTGMFEWLSI